MIAMSAQINIAADSIRTSEESRVRVTALDELNILHEAVLDDLLDIAC
jgi:hypothetical protein